MSQRKATCLQRLLCAACLACGLVPGHAAIAPGSSASGTNAAYSGNGELFMAVFDDAAKISYAFDLGVSMNDFFTIGQQDTGYQRFWPVNDANWTSFLSQVTPASLQWSVLAFDTVGGGAIGQLRMFATVKQGDECKMIDCTRITSGAPTGFSTITNQLFSTGIGAAQAGTFFTAVNTTGTHGVSGQALDYAVNGNSVNADTDTGNSYFGSGSAGLSTTLNNNAPYSMANAVGQSSWFYYLTRSGSVQLEGAQVDEFDNLGADGYFGFTYVDPAVDPASPYVGQYVLSYTLAAAGLTPAQASFVRQIGRTETSLGGSMVRLPGVAMATAGESPAGLATLRLGGLTSVASVVPEPGSALMLAAGGLLLALRRRR
jgi:hypothetical protein